MRLRVSILLNLTLLSIVDSERSRFTAMTFLGWKVVEQSPAYFEKKR